VDTSPQGSLTFCCSPENDLFRSLPGEGIRRVSDPEAAVEMAGPGSGVLLLAEEYPERPTPVSVEVLAAAARKGLRLFVEYPGALASLTVDEPRAATLERVVVASDAFGPRLEKHRILGVHGCRFVSVGARNPHLVLARVAGFDSAVFGLPEEVHPLLFEADAGEGDSPELLIATTKLSGFVTGRFVPGDGWAAVWRMILQWVSRGRETADPCWQPLVAPRFPPEAALPPDVEQTILRDGVRWFSSSRLLVHPSWVGKWEEAGEHPDRVWDAPGEDWPIGDGSHGLLEGYSSRIDEEGRQKVRWYLRGDCNAEAAMAHAFHARLTGDAAAANIARNLLDFVFFHSNLTQGPRGEPSSASYGLIGWDTRPAGAVIYYGDDNAKLLLAAGAAASLLEETRWDEKIIRAILANFRTSGRLGFRGHNLNETALAREGWQSHFRGSPTHFAPHFECWLWACYLWLYRHTGYAPLLERSRTGLRLMMEAYPDDWHWTNGLQQERGRMLLPLAWLVRVEDTAEHRGWLRRIAADLLAFQEPCGAIREEVGSAGKGRYAPPASNEEYGTTEAPLLQQNGDPLTDLLYTVNFAFTGLHEAAAVGELECGSAEARLAQFLCRVQAVSKERPEFDGAWFRAFDYRRWDFWASDADSGWGAWSIETGWTQAWICGGLGLRLADTSLWDLLDRHVPEPGLFERLRREMIPDDVLF
jgi:hypothetical protein